MPQIELEPTVVQYLRQYGYSNTLTAMVKPNQPKSHQTSITRKMTVDDSDSTSMKIIAGNVTNTVEKQARRYIDEIFSSLFGSEGYTLEHDKVQLRQRSRSITFDLKSLM